MVYKAKKMKSISLRNVPDELYFSIQEMAKANRRSLQEQVKYILEQDIRMRRGSSLNRAARWRRRLKGRKSTNTLDLIREDRRR
jgi:hypothetical protein